MVFAWRGAPKQSKCDDDMYLHPGPFARSHEERISSDWSPRFLPTTSFPRRNFCPESSFRALYTHPQSPPTPTHIA